MGILGILWNSTGFLGDSQGFSEFLEKMYEDSDVSSPSNSTTITSQFVSTKITWSTNFAFWLLTQNKYLVTDFNFFPYIPSSSKSIVEFCTPLR